MKITIVGTGYVGLVTGTCFAEMGTGVTCVDIDKEKIEKLHKGILPIYEPGLEELVVKNVRDHRLKFSTDLGGAIKDSSLVFCTVGTPPDKEGKADLKYVMNVAREVAEKMENYLVFVTKSTVPVGTALKVKQLIQQTLDKRGSTLTFDVASNPEFLKEGAAIKDFMNPDRVVVGTESTKAKKQLEKLYRPFLLNGFPIYFMDIASAEMTKYAANAMLANRISFMNDIANLCEIVGANVDMVKQGMGSDARIGSRFLYAGCGYGGSCFPKDVKALAQKGREVGYPMRIIEAVEAVNEDQKSVLFHKLAKKFNHVFKDKRVALWGLAFKPETDDMREAPSIVLIEKLLEAGAKVSAFDPIAMEEAKKIFGDRISYGKEMYEVTLDADALILVTEWKQFRLPSWKIIRRSMKGNILIDGRNIYDDAEMIKEGFDYDRIGKKIPSSPLK